MTCRCSKVPRVINVYQETLIRLFLILRSICVIDVLFYRGRRLPFLASYFAGTG